MPVGWWRHDSRLAYHYKGASLPEKTAEANSVPSLIEKQRLVLTTATKVVSTGLIIASPSVVAHDMLSMSWLLENMRLTPNFAAWVNGNFLSAKRVGARSLQRICSFAF